MVAVAGAGAALMFMQWWSVFVVLPAVVFALAIDPDLSLGQRR
jgi:hypothetical protein